MPRFNHSIEEQKAIMLIENIKLNDEVQTYEEKKPIMEKSKNNEDIYKVFNDSVHGPIKLHEVLVAIIDTPQYQRLKDIKQLGTAYWVFPGACHNRFEHGIGTSHLSGLMIETLREHHAGDINNNNLVEISDTEILCIKIAALCHDIGHGPFSHFFDGVFIKRLYPEIGWTHEYASCQLFDYMVQTNNHVMSIFQQYNIGMEQRDFIKRMIQGKNPLKDEIKECSRVNNEILKKWFLYEIVSNKRTGIDCDKFDYLSRDAHHVGMKNTFDFMRFFQNIRIKKIDNQLQICVRDKEVHSLYELFHLRWRLHRQVYQHKTVVSTEELLFKAFKAVNQLFAIDRAINDMQRYTYLTDSIIYEILRSQEENESVKQAKLMLTRLQQRDLYKMCGEIIIPSQQIDEIKTNLKNNIMSKEIVDLALDTILPDDIYVTTVYLSFGMKGKNPIENVTFYRKNGSTFRMVAEQLSHALPSLYEEWFLRVYAKDQKNRDVVTRAFGEWCKQKHIPCYDEDSNDDEFP